MTVDAIVPLLLVVMDVVDIIINVNKFHLKLLGFFNDNLEEIVKKYDGNLESIIEALLFSQNNEKNKEVVREENDKKYQPMEIEEENKSYAV